jgi:oligopeptide transport system permease protein
MARYVARRLLQMIPVFLGSTLLIFIMINLTPGDPIAARFGDRGADPAVVQQLREEFHLNENIFVQYLYYLKGVVTLDFGTSYSGQEVIDIMARAFPITVKLALLAFAIEIAIGLPLGLFTGLRRGGLFDSSALISTLVVIAIPVFVLGFLLQFFIAIKADLVSPTVGPDAPLGELLLPAIVLGSLSVAYVLRLTRTSVARTCAPTTYAPRRPRVAAQARSSVHLLRNSMIPVVTFLGADLGALMGGAIVTEAIFNVRASAARSSRRSASASRDRRLLRHGARHDLPAGQPRCRSPVRRLDPRIRYA